MDDSPNALSSIEAVYDWLDQNAAELADLQEASDKFKPVAAILRDAKDEKGQHQVWWEVNALDAVLRDGALTYQFSGSDGKGDSFVYPDLDNLVSEAYEHYERRLLQVQHPLLKARYAHLLWQGPKKNSQFAQEAIRAYLELIPLLETRIRQETESVGDRGLIPAVTAAFLLSVRTKSDLTRPKAELFRLLNDYERTSPSWFRLRHDLINLIIEHKKHLTDPELNRIPTLCLTTAEALFSSNIHGAITMYEMGKTADRKLGRQTTDWNRKIAAAYETLMIQRVNDPMSAGHFCEKSLEYYRKAKDTTKVEELERKREDFSKRIQFQTIETKIDLTEHLTWCKELAMGVAALPADEILSSIACDPALLPNPEDVLKLAQESLKNHMLLTLMPETILDKRGHVVQYAVEPDEKERAEFNKVYSYFMRADRIHLIHEVLSATYTSGKLTFDSLQQFLDRNSWLCQALSFEVASHSIKYRWIDVLEPGLKAYFDVLKASTDQAPLPSTIVLAIDSLSVKFEGLVRDLCRLNGVITTFDKMDKLSGKMVTHEKDISVLLREPVLTNILGEPDILFLKYLLTEKLGQHLRHDVAHCLLNRDEYDLGKAHLVFLGILRLSRFTLKRGIEP